MMKKLIYSTVFSLFLASIATIALAEDRHGNDKTSHIINTGAHPRKLRSMNVTHHFEVHVKGQPISALSIDLPESIGIGDGIEVTDGSNQKIDAKITIENQKATLAFAQPVAPDTNLSIKIRGINAKRYIQKILLYRVNTTMADMNQEMSIGVARINTN
jgi:hypothetical protein